MTSRERDDDGQQSVPWHNRTSTLLGASVAALAAIAVVVSALMYVTRQSGPEPAPMYFLETSRSATSSKAARSTTTRTSTLTSTSPPATTDIDPADPTSTSGPETSETSAPSETSATSGSQTTRTTPSTRPPRTRDPDDTTSRARPRANMTRALSPAP